jgi:hypothetical protein
VARRKPVWACALGAALLVTLTGCGGSGSAAPGKPSPTVMLGQQLQDMVDQVGGMGLVEWHGQLLTKNPDKGGQRIFDLDGRYSPSTGYTEVSMDSAIDGNVQQVDYLVINGRTYFNSDVWGPGAADCWADITDDPTRTWALPTNLDPDWPLTSARPVELDDEDVRVSVAFEDVVGGMPRGLFTALPDVSYDTEASGVISPHGPLIEIGIDVQGMWKKLSKQQRAAFDTRKAGWWAMTLRESLDDSSIAPPKFVFDPAVTPPSQCKRV